MNLLHFLEGKNQIKRSSTFLIFLTILFFSIPSIAQKHIPFELKFHLKSVTKDSINIETFKFYISDLKLRLNDQLVYENKHLFKLIDLSDDSNYTASTYVPSHLLFNSISFSIGVDSTTNKEGIHSGDLDPTKGMYWTWQSGYINLKLEGTSPTCPTRHHKFQYHIGGFNEGEYPLQTLIYPASNKYVKDIYIDLEKFFYTIDHTKENTIMIPGKQAVELSKKMKLAFGNK
jgi:hypothetical protein